MQKTIIKNIVLKVLFLAIIQTTYAQKEIKGSVIDHQNNTSLSNTHIVNLKDSTVVISNKRGEFILKSTGVYLFTRLGYKNKKVEITSNVFLVVQLEIEPSQLNEVIVSANQLPVSLKKSVNTINILSTKEIERGNNLDKVAILNRVPGVFMQTGTLNTNRITIRGIGSRNLFGTAKIRAYFEDIPLTTGNGETNIEDFELNSIGRFEIIKGASSSIYGAGLGGTIHLVPKKSYLNHSDISSQFLIGSYGLQKGIVNVGHGGANHSFRALYSDTHSDGYRDNNTYDRQTFTITSNHFINDTNELTFVGGYIDLKAFIPSSLNEADFVENPTAAAFTWGRTQGFEDVKRGVFGVSWKHQFSKKLKQHTSIFTSFRDGNEPRPFNILNENTLALGLRSRLLGNGNVFNRNLEWTFGGEWFGDKHTAKTFENLYENFPIGTGSVQGDQLTGFKENRNYLNLFFETKYHLSKKTLLSLGANYNNTFYTLDDQFETTGSIDQSGNYSFKGVFSPKVGLSYTISNNTSLYGAISHGFSPPTIAETLLPDGQINTDIQPETGWNFEIGTRGASNNQKLHYNLSIYSMNVRNLLVARRTAEDQFIGINAGETVHNGVELMLDYHLIQKEPVSVSTFLNFTLNDFTFKEFVDDEQNFSGNDLTGVPSQVLNAGIDVSTAFGLYGNLNFQHVGSMPITDSNSLFSDSYNLSNLKIGYRSNLSKKITLNTYFGINNVFNTTYASQILINASSFGGNAPRYFYPGTPLNYFAGLDLNYTF